MEKNKNISLPKFICLTMLSILDPIAFAEKSCMCVHVWALITPENTYSNYSTIWLITLPDVEDDKDIFKMFLPKMVVEILGIYISVYFHSSYPIQ